MQPFSSTGLFLWSYRMKLFLLRYETTGTCVHWLENNHRQHFSRFNLLLMRPMNSVLPGFVHNFVFIIFYCPLVLCGQWTATREVVNSDFVTYFIVCSDRFNSALYLLYTAYIWYHVFVSSQTTEYEKMIAEKILK